MNKKGFMFVETIVMCAILMVALLLIYNSYTSAIAREKERLNYNTIAGEYKLYYIKRYLIAEKDWACIKKDNCGIDDRFNSETRVLEIQSDELSDSIKELYNLKKVYVAKCDATLENYPTSDDEKPSEDFKNYIKTLKRCNTNYRIVGEFYDERLKQYFYSWIEYPLITTEEEG